MGGGGRRLGGLHCLLWPPHTLSGENAGVLLIIQHVSLIPALVVGTCERA